MCYTRNMTTRILIGIFVATTVFLGGMQIVAAQSQTTQTAAPTGDSISTQLSTLSEVEAKIAAKIPEPVKNWFASLDQGAWLGPGNMLNSVTKRRPEILFK